MITLAVKAEANKLTCRTESAPLKNLTVHSIVTIHTICSVYKVALYPSFLWRKKIRMIK